MDEKKLIICPVYNEESTLTEFYKRLRENYSKDVLFVDDGSKDKTPELLSGLKDSDTYMISNPYRKGYGAALIKGFDYALDKGYERIVTIDADLQHDPKHIPSFFDELSKKDVILGSRYMISDKYPEVPRERLFINRYIVRQIERMFSVYFSDPFCGYRGFRNSFLEKTVLNETSYGFSLEVLLEIIRTNTAFQEIPVEVIYLDDTREFLDGLDDPNRRLIYYLDVMSWKLKKMEGVKHEKEVLDSKSSS